MTERRCKNCPNVFTQYNTIQNLCRDCSIAHQVELQGRERPGRPLKPINSRKPIKQQGKHAAKWKLFRDKVAIPYLDNKFGHMCSVDGCSKTQSLDVDHIKPRGSHPELRYVVTNLRFLCRPHHVEVTGVTHWTKKAAQKSPAPTYRVNRCGAVFGQ